MSHATVLLPSILLGRASVEPLAEALNRRGCSTTVADTDGVDTPSRLAGRYRNAARPRDGVGGATWIAHSNAGLYLPSILRERPRDIGILVDASLPDEQPPHASVTGDRLAAIRQLADESDRLPTWVDWWSVEQRAHLELDEEQLRTLRESGPRLPLSYFTAEIDVPHDWHQLPAGYLSFDGPYVDERERMAAVGWPTTHVSTGHLGLITRPGEVAEAILDLARRLRTAPGAP